MQELINRLTEKAGISADQATKAIDTIKEFVKDKFPMMAGAVDNLFASQGADDAAPMQAATPPPPPPVEKKEEGMLDKISNVIPGQAGEKIEDFVKGAADKAEDLFDAAKDKLSGLFGGGDKDDKK